MTQIQQKGVALKIVFTSLQMHVVIRNILIVILFLKRILREGKGSMMTVLLILYSKCRLSTVIVVN